MFGGKELQDEIVGSNSFEVYDFGARNYDAALGRWMNTDPYEQFMSPYVAMGNNPVVSFDPDGGYCYDSNGNQITCGEDEFFDDVRDSDTNHHNELDEVVLEVQNSSIEDEDCCDGKLDPIGVGFAFEIGFPDWSDIKTPGFGIGVGLIADQDGIGLYITTKTIDEGGLSLSFTPEFTYVHGINEDPTIFTIEGKGYSSDGGLGPLSVEIGTGSDKSTKFKQYTVALPKIKNKPKVRNITYANWTTETLIIPIFYK